MHNVTLVCTVHEERGLCNLQELLGIIKRVSPEVIFEELSQKGYKEINLDYFHYLYRHFGVENSDKIDKLETKAAFIYRLKYDIKHIPVASDDKLPENLDNMFNNYLERFDSFCQIHDSCLRRLEEGGFTYLNSVDYSNSHNELSKIIESLVHQSNDDRMINTLKAWNDLMERHENAMLTNIYNYCKENDFDKGLFFIGAGHRASIIAKMQKFNEMEDVKINWNYTDYDEIF